MRIGFRLSLAIFLTLILFLFPFVPIRITDADPPNIGATPTSTSRLSESQIKKVGSPLLTSPVLTQSIPSLQSPIGTITDASNQRLMTSEMSIAVDKASPESLDLERKRIPNMFQSSSQPSNKPSSIVPNTDGIGKASPTVGLTPAASELPRRLETTPEKDMPTNGTKPVQ